MSGVDRENSAPHPGADERCQLQVSTLHMQAGGGPNSKHEEAPDAVIEERAEEDPLSDRMRDTELNAQRREFMKQLASVFIQIYIASKDARVEQKAA